MKARESWLDSPEKVKRLLAIGDALTEVIGQSVVPILSWDDHPRGHPNSWGSGVLVRLDETNFLFSAAHVLAAFTKAPWTVFKEVVQQVPVRSARLTGTPDLGDHENDDMDGGVCMLDPRAELGSCSFVIDREAEPIHGEVPYLLTGFPASRVETDRRGRRIDGGRVPIVLQEETPDAYSKFGYKSATHLLLRYRSHWHSAAGLGHAMNLKGASGSPLWRFDPARPTQPQLAAVFTDVKKAPGGKVLVALRSWVHMKLARQLFSDSGGRSMRQVDAETRAR
jgi:hypothetical protein